MGIETTSLYGGEIVCEFNPARHTYTIISKGRRYKVPSVTRITSVLDKSGPLVNWAINNTLDVCKGAINAGTEYAESYLEAVFAAAKRESQRLKSEAAGKGTRFHREIERELKGTGEVSDGPQRVVLDWLLQEGLESGTAQVERRLYSRRYRYSGTSDLIGYFGSERVLIDWKTGKSVYPEFRLQTAAYVHAYEEEFPDQKIEGRYLVRITEEGEVEPHYYPRSSLRKDFLAFLGAKALFDRVQQIEKQDKKSVINPSFQVS